MPDAQESDFQPEYSVGGFYEAPGSDRETHNFNVGWRFHKGGHDGAGAMTFDDGDWPLVNLPHGLEILPLEASGGINYQGEAWYRKRFEVPSSMKGKRIVLHFEGLMGKSRFWVNGKQVHEHFGGFLPAIVDVTDLVESDGTNVVAVLVDNSDDTSYPPGKPQGTLDFCYFGGIYRDVWLVATNKTHITDSNEVDVIAGGGVFVHYKNVSETEATVCVETHIYNGSGEEKALTLRATLSDAAGAELCDGTALVMAKTGESITIKQELVVANPHLWHVDDPYLHSLVLEVDDGSLLDAVRLKVGIRSIEFKGKDGFWLNGKQFDGKLIGANRHQDYAYVGNAVPNNIHWRDAVLMRQAGMRVIRCAHYPQDPSFMDACDALGMFVIITTPGWQFWSDEPIFEERVYKDIRNMVRRDRNRPCCFIWEPILNETSYPDYFAEKAHNITHEEYPHLGCYTGCDGGRAGHEHYDVVYGSVYRTEHILEMTPENHEEFRYKYEAEDRCVFTREWGDCVCDWVTQTSPSRVQIGWGEAAQLVQANHYADHKRVFAANCESLSAAPAQHVGGTLWHGTDHQRGYHADAFWGGFLDATRQKKFSYYMFQSQMPRDIKVPLIDSGPFVYIPHLVHPSSPADVTVFSNCDEVRLSVNGNEFGCKTTHPEGTHMPHHPVVFENAFEFCRHHNFPHVFVAEGIVNGEVVATYTRNAWFRRERISLEVDFNNVALQADGSDFVAVAARIVDKRGEVDRLTSDTIRFSVEGPGEIIGGDTAFINPQKLCWGEAVILLRAGTQPGTITLRAESAHAGPCKPLPAEISIETVPIANLCHTEAPALGRSEAGVSREVLSAKGMKETIAKLTSELDQFRAKEVGKQQEDFM